MSDRDDPAHDSTARDPDHVRLTVWLSGEVQGVGMRWWVRARALELGLVGSASNRADGRVEVIAEGPRLLAQRLLDALSTAHSPSRPGRIADAIACWAPARGGLSGFRER